MPDDQREAVRWFIDCGDDDFLFEGNSLVLIAYYYQVRLGHVPDVASFDRIATRLRGLGIDEPRLALD